MDNLRMDKENWIELLQKEKDRLPSMRDHNDMQAFSVRLISLINGYLPERNDLIVAIGRVPLTVGGRAERLPVPGRFGRSGSPAVPSKPNHRGFGIIIDGLINEADHVQSPEDSPKRRIGFQ